MSAAQPDVLIFALDLPTLHEAEPWVAKLAPHLGLFKIGLELFSSAGPDAVRYVHDAGSGVFLDLKLHDIPATVERAAASARRLGVKMLTVHGMGGEAMLEAAVRGAGSDVCVLAVTRLTSQRASAGDVVELAKLAQGSGCAGVVCSGHEARAVRQSLGDELRIVCPGVRPADAERGDQVRVMTPYDAIRSGANHIVVGRPIRDAADPVAATREIQAEIERAQSE